MVLASTALETRISAALDELVQLVGLNAELWEWINHRSQFWMEPSTGDQFGILLKTLTGRSLKDDGILWEAFQNIRTARNSFAHEGVAILGGTELSVPKCVARPKTDSDSGGKRTLVPGDSGHVFRLRADMF
jgi:hypothetical protein